MSAPVKLVGFLAVLGCVFGIAFLTGTQSQALLAPVQTHDSQLGGLSATDAGYTARPTVDPELRPGAGPVRRAPSSPVRTAARSPATTRSTSAAACT